MTVDDFKECIQQMHANLNGRYDFTPDNVYQTGNRTNRGIISKLLNPLLAEGSRIENWQALAELYKRSREGESCLILAEHYSNFDYPIFFKLVEQHPGLGRDAAEALLPIRGMKLSESTPITAAFSLSYDTIVIYPSRTLDAITDPAKLAEARKISMPINHAAIKEMIDRKHNGRIILVFPAGTRYREWDESSRKGVREIYSYLKTFDNVLFLAINGNTLRPNRTDDMVKDIVCRDLVIMTCSEIEQGRDYRRKKEDETPEDADPKQHIVNCVMIDLADIHERAEPQRLQEKEKLGLCD